MQEESKCRMTERGGREQEQDESKRRKRASAGREKEEEESKCRKREEKEERKSRKREEKEVRREGRETRRKREEQEESKRRKRANQGGLGRDRGSAASRSVACRRCTASCRRGVGPCPACVRERGQKDVLETSQ